MAMRNHKGNSDGVLETMCKMKPGEQYHVDWRYRRDNERGHWKRAALKGYFTKKSARGVDTFTRTAKPMVEGDSIKKGIDYSWPDINLCPPNIRIIVEHSIKSRELNYKARGIQKEEHAERDPGSLP